MLDEDIQRIRDLFCAEGEGLPGDSVAAACLRLTELLAVMQLETYDLIRNLEQVTTKRDVLDANWLLRAMSTQCSQAGKMICCCGLDCHICRRDMAYPSWPFRGNGMALLDRC